MQFGGKAGGGLSFNITRFLSLFGEYRFIFYPGFELKDRNLTYEADLNSHSVVGGISVRF
jgi:opacity protein-like surface antigen